MASSSYVALSGQLALDLRMATIANNIANAKTAGYRATGVSFNPLTSDTAAFETIFASTGNSHVSLEAGGLTRTGNPLDIAIQGEGFLSFASPSGTYYSRDGRLTMTDTGEVLNVLGHQLLNSENTPVTANPSGGKIVITKDGTVMQDGIANGQIGLFQLDLAGGFTRTSGSGLVPTSDAEQLTDFAQNGVVQGYIEESNVNPVTEMVKLIQVTRAFESSSTLANKILDNELEAIRTLGGR